MLSTRTCDACSAAIIFLRTAAGNQIPVNAETVTRGDSIYDAKKHKAHFATCPKAEEFRKRKRK